MTTNKVLYTDGRDVTVTDSTLQVKSTTYNLDGITRYGLFTIIPDRLPAIMILGVGILLLIAGGLHLISSNMISDFNIRGNEVSANTIALWIGGGFMLIGLLVAVAMHKRYAVRITTAEGEKDAVVSRKKEYVAQIVNALNDADKFFRGRRGTTPTYATL
jgi:hypothetical protein